MRGFLVIVILMTMSWHVGCRRRRRQTDLATDDAVVIQTGGEGSSDAIVRGDEAIYETEDEGASDGSQITTQEEELPRFVVVSPNVFRLEVEETVYVSVHGSAETRERQYNVTVEIQDAYGWTQHNPHNVTVTQVRPAVAKLKLLPSHLTSEDPYVWLRLSRDGRVLQRKKILVSLNSGLLFIQTDKPLYTPGQEVKIRVLTLDEDTIPSEKPVTVAVLNHNGDVTERWADLTTVNGFISRRYTLPSNDQFGNWTVTASYYLGEELTIQRRTFEVKKYVLPTFSLGITYPTHMILPEHDEFNFTITASFTHGHAVNIRGHIGVGVVKTDGAIESVRTFDRVRFKGSQAFIVNLRDHSGMNHEPGAKLKVEAYLHDQVTSEPQTLVDKTVVFRLTSYAITFHGTRQFFHPGMPFEVQLQVKTHDGVPVKNKSVQLHIQPLDENGATVGALLLHGTTTQEGSTYTSFNIPAEARSLSMRAKMRPEDELAGYFTVVEFIASRFQSEYVGTSPALTVRHPGTAKISQERIDLNVRLSSAAPTDLLIHCLVVVRGRMIHTEIMRVAAGSEDINTSIRTLYAMTPSFRLIMYYVLSGGDVITDSLWIDVEDQCHTPLEITTEHDDLTASRPGDKVQILISGEPQATVGVTATDKSIYFLSDKNVLTKDRLYKWLETYDLGFGSGRGVNYAHVFKDAGMMVVSNTNIDVEYRNDPLPGSPLWSGSLGPTPPPSVADAGPQVELSNIELLDRKKRFVRMRGEIFLVLNSHNALTRRCCELATEHTRADDRTPCFLLSITRTPIQQDECRYAYEKCCLHSRQPSVPDPPRRGRHGIRGFDALGSSPWGVGQAAPRRTPRRRSLIQDFQIRTYFPETWLFQLIGLDDGGSGMLDETIPHSITSWMIQAVSISRRNGLCVAQPRNITAWKPMYIKLIVPRAAIIREQIQIRATIYNYLPDWRNVTVSLKGSVSFCSGLEDGVLGHHEVKLVAPGEAVTFTFSLVPIQAGISNVTIQMQTHDFVDVVTKRMIVKAPGRPTRRQPCNIRIDPSEHEVGTTLTFGCATVNYTLAANGHRIQVVRFDGAISSRFYPGTESAALRITGEAMANVVYQLKKRGNLERLVGLPQDCGEQTTMKLSLITFLYDYLRQTNQLTDKVERVIQRHIKSGYSHLLEFKNGDGAFSVFRAYLPSSWLTAYVAKTLCKASTIARDSLNMQKTACDAMRWIADLEQMPDGSINDGNAVRSSVDMTGKTIDGTVTFTAFTLLAHHQCSCSDMDPQFQRGMLSYLLREDARSLSQGASIYQLAIMSYALSLYREEAYEIPVALTALMEKARDTDDGVYWRIDGTDAEPTGVEIETAAYAALALMAVGNDADAGRVLKWLNSYKNREGGFVNTQDTVVAFQAITEYHRRNDRRDVNLDVLVTSEADHWYNQSLALTENNRMLVNAIKQIPVGDDVTVKVAGTGTAQLSFDVQYNVQESDDRCGYFDLSARVKIVDLERLSRSAVGARGRSLRATAMTDIVIRYRLKEPYNRTGMAILNVQLPTGYTPETNTLAELEAIDDVQKIVRTDTGVVIYLKKVTNEEKTLPIRTISYTVTGHHRPQTVTLYDYYEKAKTHCTVFYHPRDHGHDLCTYARGSHSCQCRRGTRCASCVHSLDIDVLKDNACRTFVYSFSGRVINVDTDRRSNLTTITLRVNYPIRPRNDPLIQRGVLVVLKKYTECDCPRIAGAMDAFIMANKRYLVKDYTTGLESVAITLNKWTYALPWSSRRRTSLTGKLARFNNYMKMNGCDGSQHG